MINLLTEEQRLNLKQEYRHRRLVVGGFLIGALLLLALALAGLILLNLRQRHSALASATAPTNASLEREARRTTLALTSSELRLLQSNQNRVSITSLWEPILQARPAGIRLTHYLWEPGAKSDTLSLSGKATTRAALLNFVTALQNEPLLKSVDSPISNLIKNRDLDFTLRITLTPNNNKNVKK